MHTMPHNQIGQANDMTGQNPREVLNEGDPSKVLASLCLRTHAIMQQGQSSRHHSLPFPLHKNLRLAEHAQTGCICRASCFGDQRPCCNLLVQDCKINRIGSSA